MQKINSDTSLRAEIQRLELRQTVEGQILKEHFLVVHESLKPVNLILHTLKEITTSSKLKDNILNTSLGLITGSVSKLLFERGTRNPVKKVLGNALMFGIVNLVARNPETVRSVGTGILKLFSGKLGGRHHAL